MGAKREEYCRQKRSAHQSGSFDVDLVWTSSGERRQIPSKYHLDPPSCSPPTATPAPACAPRRITSRTAPCQFYSHFSVFQRLGLGTRGTCFRVDSAGIPVEPHRRPSTSIVGRSGLQSHRIPPSPPEPIPICSALGDFCSLTPSHPITQLFVSPHTVDV